MQTTTSDYDTAVTATVRQSVATLAVDWDDDGDFTDAIDDVTRYVKSITVDRALTTDLPEQARLVTGYASTKLTAQLGGDPTDLSKTAAVLWSPYSADSDYYNKTRIGADVRAKLGLNTESGDELFTVFSGKTTKIGLARGQATATLEALDGAEKLRGPVHLDQMVAVDASITSFRPGLNSQAVIERILALGGYHASPPARDDAVLAVTLHGTAYPQVGTLTDANSTMLSSANTPVPYVQGKWGLAASSPQGGATTMHWDTTEQSIEDGAGLLVEAWIARPADAKVTIFGENTGSADTLRLWELNVDTDGSVQWLVERSSTAESDLTATDVVPDDGALHYVAVYSEYTATGMTVTFNVDGSESSGSEVVEAATGTADSTWDVGLSCGPEGVESIQVATGIRATVDWQDAWSPTALLEPGLSELTAIPSTDADDAWALLQEIVGAEFGTLMFNGSGTAVFRNRQYWRKNTTANTVQRTLTATDSILDLSTVELADQVRNRIRVPVQPLTIQSASIIWQEHTINIVPAKDTLTLWAQPEGQFLNVDTTGWVIPEGGATGTNGGNKSGYRASRRQDGTGGQVSNLTMTITPFSSTVKIEFTNPNSFPAYLVSPHGGTSPNGGSTYPSTSDGVPVIQIVGQAISAETVPTDTDTVDPSIAATGTVVEAALSGLTSDTERLYTAPSSPWRQSVDSAQSCADDLLRALHRPVPQVQDLSIIADPSLELGDRVQIKDETGTKLDDPFWVVGITTTYSATGGMTQTVTLRPVAAPGQFIFGVTGRDLVGTTPL